MDTIELLAKFSDPQLIETLSTGNRLFAGLITTVLGMGITLVSLVVLQVVMAIMAKFTAPASSAALQADTVGSAAESVDEPDKADAPVNDEELVAAIATALALQLKTSVGNIVIRNIEKVEDTSSAWHRAGIAEQMNNSQTQ
ncbi:MAG: OadG family transporter subunit [Desulfopila sp.]